MLVNRIRATVRDGRLVVDLETDLPEGTVLELVPVDDGDDLTPDAREQLHRAIEIAWEAVRNGEHRGADSVLEDLRPRSG